MTIYFSLLVCIIGGLIYLLVNANVKVQELGRLAFATGLLAFLLTGIEHLVNVLPR